MKTNEKVTKNEKEMITKIINKELDGMKSQTITTGEMNNHLGNILDSIINQTIGKEPEQLPSMKQSEMDINELLVYNELKNYQKEKCFFIDFNLDVTKMVKKAFYVTLIDTGVSGNYKCEISVNRNASVSASLITDFQRKKLKNVIFKDSFSVFQPV